MQDSQFLQQAADLARLHNPHPNPRVGAVVVNSDRVVGEGFHIAPGEDHAEVVALNAAGRFAEGATVYVTLEPCSHTGRTPPCVGALIQAGVARVVVAAVDPDDRVSGRGIRALADVGIQVDVAADESDGRAVDPAYFHHRETGRPLVTLKYAMTLDGSVAAMDRSSRWITGEEAREDVHQMRADVDAVLVGAGTLRADDPRLNVRLDGYEGRQPRPVVVAGERDLPVTAAIWERDPLVVSTRPRELPAGELVVVEAESPNPDPVATCTALAERGMIDLILEGGPTLVRTWLSSGVIARGVAYLGAKLGGGRGLAAVGGEFVTIGDAIAVRVTNVRTLGSDLRIDFEVS